MYIYDYLYRSDESPDYRYRIPEADRLLRYSSTLGRQKVAAMLRKNPYIMISP